MPLPAVVLVHGGTLAADCWDLAEIEIRSLCPELDILAVDLPGRRSKPANLLKVTTADWVDSAVSDIEDAGLNDIVIVGHSMAGLTVPGVVTKLGGSRVREMILAAACVPADGAAMVDVLSRPTAVIARHNAKKAAPYTVPPAVARFGFFNGVSRKQCRWMTGRFYPESSQIPTEKVSRRNMPQDVPRTPGSSRCATAHILSKNNVNRPGNAGGS